MESALIKSIKKFGYQNEVPSIVYDPIKKEVFMGIHRLEACRELGVQPHIVDGLGRKYKLDKNNEIVPDF